MTSGEMAEKLNIPVRTIGCYERGEVLPSAKFLVLLYEKLGININWLLTGNGSIFLAPADKYDTNFVEKATEEFKISPAELDGLFEILGNEASKNMLLKFIEVKKGNKESLDALIDNLQGIKAIYG